MNGITWATNKCVPFFLQKIIFKIHIANNIHYLYSCAHVDAVQILLYMNTHKIH